MSSLLYTSLSDEYLGDAPNIGEPSAYIRSLLVKELPKSELRTLNSELHWQFLLEKHSSKNKKAKRIRKKKTVLTRKERKELDILKLPKTGWDYGSLGAIRRMWRQYMKHNLELAGPAPSCTDPEWASFSTIMAKSELIGSEVRVARSKVPTHVGITGTIVLETKMTFQIVTPKSEFKIIPKSTSVFEFIVDNLKFTIFGKHIIAKPSERSVKKIKSQMSPDL